MKTFLLMLGSAVCGVVIFVAATSGYFYYNRSRLEAEAQAARFPPRNEKTVSALPPMAETKPFYGVHGSWSGDFSNAARETVLAAGPGKLVGSVTSVGKPQNAVRLRLALNGAAMSQWATSGVDGKYEVALPYGTYRIDGYELDSTVANTALGGTTDGPRHVYDHRETIVVAEGKPGKAIDFTFVYPVTKKGPSGDVSLARPVIVSWEPYPNATSYRLQLIEQKDPRDYTTNRGVFEWQQQPIVTATSANLAEYKVALKKGYYYTVEIEALGERRMRLSASTREFYKPDFRVVD